MFGLFTGSAEPTLELLTISVKDTVCDPLFGEFTAQWTFAGPAVLGTISIQYNFDGSGTYLDIPGATGIDPATLLFAGVVNDLPGYPGSLNDTYFKIRLLDGLGVDAEGSPQFAAPTYSCL